ncbi:MAG: DUF3857 domain-containing transglutaminase family protein [Candidatus Zixiibacteriota bacterium]
MNAAPLLTALAIGSAAIANAPSLPPGDTPPPTVFSLVKDIGDASKYDSAAYVIVVDSTLNQVNDRGVSRSESYLLYKVLTDEGSRNLSVLTWHYEPLSNWIDVRRVNIIRGGRTIPVALDALRDLPAPQSAIYWGDRMKALQLPRLEVGDGIEVVSFRKGYSYALLDSTRAEPGDERYIPPMPGQYFDIVLFESDVPMGRKVYVLRLPVAKRLHSQVYNGSLYSRTGYSGDTTTYAWWQSGIAAHKSERFRPAVSDLYTKVVLATVESWEAKSRWFFEVNEPQFEYTSAIKAKVDEILAAAGVGNGTDEQKAFALVHWVAQNIRYSGQSMGVGEGYTLHPGAMIFEQRSGVCKDIAGMLITMMRAAGLDSYAAMTMAGSRIEQVPADQFNHCVVALRKSDGTFEMYDPTWVPFNNDIWSLLETEQHYLIGSPEGRPLSRIRFSPAEESPLVVTSTGRILADGTYEGQLELHGQGAVDGRLRRMAAYNHIAELDNYLADVLHHAGDQVELVRFEHGDVLDFGNDMWWRIDFRIPHLALPVDGGWEFRSPMMQTLLDNGLLLRAASADWPEKRDDDLFFYYTQQLDATEVIQLPAGYRVTKPPQSKAIDETYASFKGESEMTSRGLVIKQKAALKRRQIPPGGYRGFRDAFQELRRYAGVVFRAEKGGAR